MMNRIRTILPILAFGLTIFMVVSCAKVPITGRKQTKLISSAEMNQMAFANYDEFISTAPLTTNQAYVDDVREIGENIKKAAERYFKATNNAKALDGYEWEFNVVEDPLVNAWAMPGGKVVVYTGILSVAKNTDGLAVVMGHEIAHALAHHGNERMSQGLLVNLGGATLNEAISKEPAATKTLFEQAYGLGAQFGAVLPFSRKHESEADEIGLMLMAAAGYDPTEGAPFWTRMNAMGGQAPPEFMSTHPAPEKRSETLQSLIPEAQAFAAKYGDGKKQPRKTFR